MKKKAKNTDTTPLPKLANPPSGFDSAIGTWTKHRLSSRSGYYAGRGPKRGDLGPDHLDMLFEGIKKDFSPQHAQRFLEFVEGLTDLSASAFLVAFEYFFSGGCSNPKGYAQRPGDFAQISAHDDGTDSRMVEGMCAIFSAMGDNRPREFQEMESRSIKMEFLMRHGRSRGDDAYGRRGRYGNNDCFFG